MLESPNQSKPLLHNHCIFVHKWKMTKMTTAHLNHNTTAKFKQNCVVKNIFNCLMPWQPIQMHLIIFYVSTHFLIIISKNTYIYIYKKWYCTKIQIKFCPVKVFSKYIIKVSLKILYTLNCRIKTIKIENLILKDEICNLYNVKAK